MQFSENSNVSLVITSCGRFKLLKKTLESFDNYNTYPIKKIIITEDSGNEKVENYIPQHWLNHCNVIINNPKLGQIPSIDLAYSLIDTDYIFHCEDDWSFYREGFIEDSLEILKKDNNILQVWLRDLKKDVLIRYPFHYAGKKDCINNINYFHLESTDNTWKGFSFNPGLRRLNDYLPLKPFHKEGKKAEDIESELSKKYYQLGKYAVILENSAVEHIGWDNHINNDDEVKRLKKKRNRKIKYVSIGFVLGILFTFLLEYIVRGLS